MKPTRRSFVAGLLAVAAAPAARSADRETMKAVAEKLMCNCGCNQLLMGCTHIGCPNSGPMKKELQAFLDQGLSEEAILAKFVEKYGAAILSAPPASGFNLSAWITPFVVLAGGFGVAAYVVRTWKSRGPAEGRAAAGGDGGDTQAPTPYRDRLEKELRNYSPED